MLPSPVIPAPALPLPPITRTRTATSDLPVARTPELDSFLVERCRVVLLAVLRERLNGIGLASLQQAGPWLGDLPPGKMTVYVAGSAASATSAAGTGLDPLAAFVRCKDAAAASALFEAGGMRCATTVALMRAGMTS